jgi:glycosyltransferase involved in cell wall biosynthesis
MTSNKKKCVWVFSQDESYPERGSLVRHYFLGQHYSPSEINLSIICGNNSHFLTNPPKFKTRFFKEIKDSITFLWVKLPFYKRTNGFLRSSSWILFLLYSFMVPRKLKTKPDIIIVSSFPFFPILFAFCYKLFHRKVKVILEIRDIYPLTLMEIGELSKYHPVVQVLGVIEKLAYRFSDHIVSVLPNAFEHIKKTVKKPAPFTWISNGISELVINNSSTDNIDLPEGFNVCYAGSLGFSYALKELVQAGKELEKHGVNIIILGDGPARKELETIAGNAPNVIFLGKVPKLNVQKYLNKCNILYLGWKKSILWRFGIASNKLFDYMLSGKVILAACNFDNKIISASRCGFVVETENKQALKNKILEIKELSLEERNSIGSNGRSYLLKNLTYSKLAQKYLSIFESV